MHISKVLGAQYLTYSLFPPLRIGRGKRSSKQLRSCACYRDADSIVRLRCLVLSGGSGGESGEIQQSLGSFFQLL